MTKHQLNDPAVDAVGQQLARASMPQVVPSEIDPLELFPIPCGAFSRGLRLVAIRSEDERLWAEH